MTDQADRLQAVLQGFLSTFGERTPEALMLATIEAKRFIAMSDADAAWREKQESMGKHTEPPRCSTAEPERVTVQGSPSPMDQPPSAPEGDLYWQIVEQLSMVHDATIRGEDNKIAERANLLMEKIAAHRPSAPEGDVERVVARKVYDLLVLHHGTSYNKVAEYIAHAISPAPQQARSDLLETSLAVLQRARGWFDQSGEVRRFHITPEVFAAMDAQIALLQSALAAKR